MLNVVRRPATQPTGICVRDPTWSCMSPRRGLPRGAASIWRKHFQSRRFNNPLQNWNYNLRSVVARSSRELCYYFLRFFFFIQSK
jgi:hypothetical protein